MRRSTFVLLGLMTVLLFGAVAAPAAAEITEGQCRGQATFPEKATDQTLDASRPLDQVFEAPLSATVNYSGDLGPGATPSDEKVPFSGGVVLRIPRMSITVASWDGETELVSDADSYTYDLPDFVPAGTGGMQLTGFHNHTGYAPCAAIVTVSIAGDPGAVAIGATAAAGLAAAGTLAAGRRKP